MGTVDVRIQPPRSLDRSVEAEGDRQAPPFEQRDRKACIRTESKASRASRLDAPPCLPAVGGEESRPCDDIYISRKPLPCLSRLNAMGGELRSASPYLTGKCPVSRALEGLPLKAGSLPTGRQEGAHYKRKVPSREATPFRAWSFK